MNTKGNWMLILALSLISAPLVIMYGFQLIDSVSRPAPGGIIPQEWELTNWRFLWTSIDSARPSIWRVTFNTFVFASATALLVCAFSITAAYALSRLNFPARRFFLAGLIMLHAFPTITLIIAIFIVLQFLGLYDSLMGVILVKAALELPFGIWIMKGFYDSVPWEIEMAGIQDGASRFTVWRRLVLPQVRPALLALGLFSFLAGWSEFILPQVLTPGNEVQVLSVYLAGLIADDNNFDMALFKAVGVFYVIPVMILFIFFQKHLMNIFGGGSKG